MHIIAFVSAYTLYLCGIAPFPKSYYIAVFQKFNVCIQINAVLFELNYQQDKIKKSERLPSNQNHRRYHHS